MGFLVVVELTKIGFAGLAVVVGLGWLVGDAGTIGLQDGQGVGGGATVVIGTGLQDGQGVGGGATVVIAPGLLVVVGPTRIGFAVGELPGLTVVELFAILEMGFGWLVVGFEGIGLQDGQRVGCGTTVVVDIRTGFLLVVELELETGVADPFGRLVVRGSGVVR